MRKRIAVVGAGAVGGYLGGQPHRDRRAERTNRAESQERRLSGADTRADRRYIVRRVERCAVTPRPELLFDA
jgi:ketopantoate reductase